MRAQISKRTNLGPPTFCVWLCFLLAGCGNEFDQALPGYKADTKTTSGTEGGVMTVTQTTTTSWQNPRSGEREIIEVKTFTVGGGHGTSSGER